MLALPRVFSSPPNFETMLGGIIFESFQKKPTNPLSSGCCLLVDALWILVVSPYDVRNLQILSHVLLTHPVEYSHSALDFSVCRFCADAFFFCYPLNKVAPPSVFKRVFRGVPLEDLIRQNLLRPRIQADYLGCCHCPSCRLVNVFNPFLNSDYVYSRDQSPRHVH